MHCKVGVRINQYVMDVNGWDIWSSSVQDADAYQNTYTKIRTVEVDGSILG